MRKVKGNIRKMLAAIVLTLLCCSAFAQRIVESGDLRTTTDEQHGTVVHYLKGGKRPLSGKFRILRGQDEEIVHFSKGVMQGEYRRFRNGSLREKGKYTDGRRHGLFVSYHQDGKTPQREAPMQYGKIDGTVRTWFSDGKPDMVQEYRQGKRNGKEQRFDPKSGKQIYEANYTDDRKEGKQWKISEDTTERWVSKRRTGRPLRIHGPPTWQAVRLQIRLVQERLQARFVERNRPGRYRSPRRIHRGTRDGTLDTI